MKRVKLRIPFCDFFPKNQKGLSMIASAIIIMALTIGIGVIVIIIYNVVTSELEYSNEANISLEIVKNSVVVGDDVSLTVTRDLGDADLQRIRFVVSDGENAEEIEKDAKDLEELGEKNFVFTPKLVLNIKTIKIVPVVKINGKMKYCSVQSSVEIKQQAGQTIVEKTEFICGNAKLETGEQCDDGNTIAGDGCSAVCKIESCATQKGKICSSGQTCPSGKTLKSSDTGVCCSVDCVSPTTTTSGTSTSSTTPTCGDGSCLLPESCSTCVTDCGICGITYTYSWYNGDWGTCTDGTKTRIVYCKRSDGEQVADSYCSGTKPATSETCTPGTSLLDNGQICSSGSECSSGYCVDGVCCGSSSCSTCKACNITGSLGTCTNVPNGQDPASECSPITCTDYIYGWDGTSCKKYSTATGNNGMCNGAGACASVGDSCSGVGIASASCGSVGCKKACVAGGLATSYDSVGEVCYTSGTQSCSSGYACDATGNCVAQASYATISKNCQSTITCNSICTSNGYTSCYEGENTPCTNEGINFKGFGIKCSGGADVYFMSCSNTGFGSQLCTSWGLGSCSWASCCCS